MYPQVVAYDTYDSSDTDTDTNTSKDLISDTDSSFSDADLPSMVAHFQDCDACMYPSAMLCEMGSISKEQTWSCIEPFHV